MYKAILVDDEGHTRKGLREFIDWETLGIQICGEADDGLSALPLIEKNEPDILITDVRMRHMDGITLSKKARIGLPFLEVVFLSGYNDPDYLQNAVRLEAADYLYKPITPEEFTQVMISIVSKLDNRRERETELNQMRQKIEESIPILRQSFLSQWLDGVYEDPAELLQKINSLHFDFAPEVYLQPIVIYIERYASAQLPLENLLLKMQCIIKQRLKNAACCTQAKSIVAIVPFTKTEEQMVLNTIANEICQDMQGHYRVWLSASLGHMVQDWLDLPASYQQAVGTLENRYFSQQGQVFESQKEVSTVHTNEKKFQITSFIKALRSANYDAVISQLLNIGREVEVDRMSFAAARLVCLNMATLIAEELQSMRIEDIDVLKYMRSMMDYVDYESIENALRSLIFTTVHHVKAARDHKFTKPVAKVISILESEFAQRLTIVELAKRVNYSPAYLCDLFKSEVNKTIGEYLLDIRMDKAQEFLRTSTRSVLNIALDVGYQEQTHFTRLFKRHTGLTPLEYRRRDF